MLVLVYAAGNGHPHRLGSLPQHTIAWLLQRAKSTWFLHYTNSVHLPQNDYKGYVELSDLTWSGEGQLDLFGCFIHAGVIYRNWTLTGRAPSKTRQCPCTYFKRVSEISEIKITTWRRSATCNSVDSKTLVPCQHYQSKLSGINCLTCAILSC